MSGKSEFLLEKLPLIERVIASICRRKGMCADEIEEFAGIVRLRLVENDYAILRAFQGRSRFATYIASVIGRMLLDHHNQQWGKWRKSAEAERMGELAVALEKLLYRDERSQDEAFAILAPSYPEVTRERIDELSAKIPGRVKRRMVTIEEALSEPAQQEADPAVIESAHRISLIVTESIGQFSNEDQLILQLRFESEMSIAQISRSLHIDQQLLYRRFRRLLSDLRQALLSNGISAAIVDDLISRNLQNLDFDLKNRKSRPSQTGESTVAGRQKETPS